MNNKFKGVVLLCSAAMVAAIGTVGEKIAAAIVLGGFYSGSRSGIVPPGPQEIGMDNLLIYVTIVLVASGLILFLLPDSKNGKINSDGN